MLAVSVPVTHTENPLLLATLIFALAHLQVTGGANVPAINDLLKPFGIGFSDRVFDGAWSIGPGAQSQVRTTQCACGGSNLFVYNALFGTFSLFFFFFVFVLVLYCYCCGLNICFCKLSSIAPMVYFHLHPRLFILVTSL